jgi:hypothetical protein
MAHSANLLYVMGDCTGDMGDLENALEIAKKSQSSVRVLCVMESLPRLDRMLITALPTGELRNRVVSRRLRQLEELIAMIRPDGVDLQARVRFGNRAKETVREAAEFDCDLVIKRPEKGRTDRYLARHCNCPVQLLESQGLSASGQSVTGSGLLRRLQERRTRHDTPPMNTGREFFAG